jgi:hypothetical protein
MFRPFLGHDHTSYKKKFLNCLNMDPYFTDRYIIIIIIIANTPYGEYKLIIYAKS